MHEQDIQRIYELTLKRYDDAFQHLIDKKSLRHGQFRAISDAVPGYSSEWLEFGACCKENYAVLFVDMRHSTSRAESCGPENTFLTMHVFLTALLEVVDIHEGCVVDITGDGLMVFWGGSVAREQKSQTKRIAAQEAGLCGLDMLEIIEKVVNRIIVEKELKAKVAIGVGVDYGSVIVTKLGTEKLFDVKAFGSCINKASKYADSISGKVKVSKQVKNLWPTDEDGRIGFLQCGNDDAYILSKD